jgi:hypothetical protein
MFYIRQRPSSVAKRLARHFTFGRSRVLTPVPPDQVWVFFKSFPTPSHRGMSHITDKANAGSESTIHTVPIPNLPVSVTEKALESLLCYLFSTFFTLMFFSTFFYSLLVTLYISQKCYKYNYYKIENKYIIINLH